uniref:S1 RNA-binding domain-containing protein 1 n=1 Tax=Magallana gigas TaxID=29159 RepID=K1QKY3_MAGGI
MSDFTPSWVLEELIGERTQLKQWAVKNVVQMLHDGATIPFIARYRKEQTGGMEVDKLREIKNQAEELNIVKEDGASIYSCSDLAKAELPDLDLTLRGAVSIARRLLDPLAELVKIEPKHIGVGQYQHDIPESQLKVALDSVVEECVSFVGVDLNTGSEALLRRVAGLNLTKAKSVVERREKKGPFTNRNQLKLIKGFGEKSFQQCAGFLRVNHSNFVVE